MKAQRLIILNKRLERLNRIYRTITHRQLDRFYNVQATAEHEFYLLASELLSKNESLVFLLK